MVGKIGAELPGSGDVAVPKCPHVVVLHVIVKLRCKLSEDAMQSRALQMQGCTAVFIRDCIKTPSCACCCYRYFGIFVSG